MIWNVYHVTKNKYHVTKDKYHVTKDKYHVTLHFKPLQVYDQELWYVGKVSLSLHIGHVVTFTAMPGTVTQ